MIKNGWKGTLSRPHWVKTNSREMRILSLRPLARLALRRFLFSFVPPESSKTRPWSKPKRPDSMLVWLVDLCASHCAKVTQLICTTRRMCTLHRIPLFRWTKFVDLLFFYVFLFYFLRAGTFGGWYVCGRLALFTLVRLEIDFRSALDRHESKKAQQKGLQKRFWRLRFQL